MLRIADIVSVGRSLQVTYRNRIYPSLLLDIDDRYMYIGVIQLEGQWIHLPPGTQIEVSFGVPERGFFRFLTRVEDEVLQPAPALKITYPDNLERLQQRRFYRLNVQLPVSYRNISDLKAHRSFITCFAHTIDLSAGGVQLQVFDRVKLGELLELDLILGQKPLSLLARVLRVIPNLDGSFMIAAAFEQLDPRHEETIIRFVFQEQARRRKLGLR